MKNLLAFTLCLLIGSASCLAQGSDVFLDKYKQIQKDFDARDLDAFSNHFLEKVNFISPMGTHCSTKECVYEGHKQLFEMWGTASGVMTNDIKVLQSFDIGTDNHLLSVESKHIVGEETYHHAYTFIFEKSGNEWMVKSAQLTPVITLN